MSLTAIGPIEKAVHTTNIWLKELTEELGWEDRQRAYHALGVVLHALRDRLTVAEAADFARNSRCWSAASITRDGTRAGSPSRSEKARTSWPISPPPSRATRRFTPRASPGLFSRFSRDTSPPARSPTSSMCFLFKFVQYGPKERWDMSHKRHR